MDRREQEVFDLVRKKLSSLPRERACQLVRSLLDGLGSEQHSQAGLLLEMCGAWRFEPGEREEIRRAIEEAREREEPWQNTSSTPTM